MRKGRVISVLIVAIMLVTSNTYAKNSPKEENVTLVNEGNYYEVSLNLEKVKSHSDLGKGYAEKILKEVPNYEALIDSYLAEMTGSDAMYNAFMQRVNDIKPQINKDYRDEIEGMASKMSPEDTVVRGDGKLCMQELYMYNLFPDIARATKCSALGVYGKRSATKNTMAGRILDWSAGSQNQLAQIQCVMTIENGKNSICTVGYLGFLGVISGFNDDKVFAAILDSKTGEKYASESKRSYTLDLRYALEKKKTINEVASYMKEPKSEYAIGHLIFLCDSKTAAVLENNLSTSQAMRAVRTEKSLLNEEIEWGIDNSIGTVNSFILKGNFDNHSSQASNTKRWKSMKEQLLTKGDSVTLDEIKQIVSFHNGGSSIGKQEDGSLYNVRTQQIIIFEPKSFNLQIFFRPKDGALPSTPNFETIKVKF